MIQVQILLDGELVDTGRTQWLRRMGFRNRHNPWGAVTVPPDEANTTFLTPCSNAIFRNRTVGSRLDFKSWTGSSLDVRGRRRGDQVKGDVAAFQCGSHIPSISEITRTIRSRRHNSSGRTSREAIEYPDGVSRALERFDEVASQQAAASEDEAPWDGRLWRHVTLGELIPRRRSVAAGPCGPCSSPDRSH